MKKFIAFLMLAIAFGAVLTGCSGGEKTEEPAKTETTAGDAGAAAPAEGGAAPAETK